jgi:hypothetical protein
MNPWPGIGESNTPQLGIGGGNFWRFKRSKNKVMPAKPKSDQQKPATKSKAGPPASTEEERKRRQSDRLDEALLETFPASDSVSIGRVK